MEKGFKSYIRVLFGSYGPKRKNACYTWGNELF